MVFLNQDTISIYKSFILLYIYAQVVIIIMPDYAGNKCTEPPANAVIVSQNVILAS